MRYHPLTRNNEFARAYTRGKSFVHPHVVLYVNKNRLGRTRVGITASKKIGNAVTRNRARRVLRCTRCCRRTWAGTTWCWWPAARHRA